MLSGESERLVGAQTRGAQRDTEYRTWAGAGRAKPIACVYVCMWNGHAVHSAGPAGRDGYVRRQRTVDGAPSLVDPHAVSGLEVLVRHHLHKLTVVDLP